MKSPSNAAPRFSKRVLAARTRVKGFLRAVSRQSPALLNEFPRPIEDMALLCHGKLHLKFIEQSNLTEESISRTLLDRFGIRSEDVDINDKSERYGFLYCHGNRVFVFSNPSFGEPSNRFTKAHEIGHLFLQYLKQFDSAGQMSLLGESTKQSFLACRETYVELSPSLSHNAKPSWADEYERRAEQAYWLNESIMNAFAAELLAPFKSVQQLISGIHGEEAKIDAVREKFGLSKESAKYRVEDSTPLASASESLDYALLDDLGDDEWTRQD